MNKFTVLDLAQKKTEGVPIVVVTAYDHAGAKLVDAAGCDIVLVGDSLGMVVQGHESTLPVTMDDMVYHTRCVSRARPRAMVVTDLPFGTFQLGAQAALEASVRAVQEGGSEAVKIEGAGDRLAAIEKVAQADIPVFGHIGLTPQSVHALGGYRVQGKGRDAARKLLAAAEAVQAAGACAIVLEAMPPELAQQITQRLLIPTIGIGAGPHCDGQVLVFHDVLGWYDAFVPKFVRRYAQAGADMQAALERFALDVRERRFPTLEESYGAPRVRQGERGETP
jgi:3-methyl-2-oxobutanoate hydroxymethyltransferase